MMYAPAPDKRKNLRRLLLALGLLGTTAWTIKKGHDISEKTKAEAKAAKNTAWIKKILPRGDMDLSDIVNAAGNGTNLLGDIMNLVKSHKDIKKGKEEIAKNEALKAKNKDLAKAFYDAKQKYNYKDLITALAKHGHTQADVDSDEFEGMDPYLKEKYADVLKNKHFSQTTPRKIYFSDMYDRQYYTEDDPQKKWLRRLIKLGLLTTTIGSGYMLKKAYDRNKQNAELEKSHGMLNNVKVSDLIQPTDALVNMIGHHVNNKRKDVEKKNKDILQETKEDIKSILKKGVGKTRSPKKDEKAKSSAGDIAKDIGSILKSLSPLAEKYQDYKIKG